VIRRALTCPELEDDHVALILKVIQTLCRKHYLDYEAAIIILQLLCGMYNYVSRYTRCLKSHLMFNLSFFIIERRQTLP
jgi:hypothetical protein